MKAYLYDKDTGWFAGAGECEPGDVPGSWIHPINSTLAPPPPIIPEGKAARYNYGFWEIVDLPTPEALRQRAYESEADPLRDQAISYQLEGDAWEARGDDGRAEIAWTKAAEFMGKYLDVKEAIRAKYS